MLYGCSSLVSLDLSSFNTKNVRIIEKMFYGLNNLKYLNLKNFELQNNLDYTNIIDGIPKNVIVCIDHDKAPVLYQLIENLNCDNIYFLYQLIENLNCDNIYCSDDWISHQKKLNKETNECIDNCNDKYEFNSKCYDICPYGTFHDEINSVEKCKCENEKCYSCLDIEDAKNLCITCNKSFYPIENDPMNIGPYINCYKDLDGYFLDKSNENNYIYKLCYETCKTCEKKGDNLNNNCLECKSEYPFQIIKNNSVNCYKNCTYYYYFDQYGNYECTITNSCPKEYNKLIMDNRECTNNCELNKEFKYEFGNKCYSQCPKESKESINKEYYCEAICSEEKPFVIIETQECVEFCDITKISKSCILRYIEEINEENNEIITEENKEKIEEIKKTQEIKKQDKILENLEKGFTSENYNTSELENGKDSVIKTEKMTITLTTTDNQKSNDINDTSTKVDIGPCEDILRNNN